MRKLIGVGLFSALGLILAATACDPGDPDDGDKKKKEDVDYLTTENLSEIARFLSSDDLGGRNEGSPGHETARNYIIDYLKACSVKPAGDDGFKQQIVSGAGTNILGQVEGTGSNKDRWVVLSAHYDHLGTQGADIYNGAGDNAAAVAEVLGVACELVENPLSRSVLIAIWDSEEPPTYMTGQMGSEFYALNTTVSPLDKIDVAIALDLVGLNMWPGHQGHIIMGSELSPEITTAVEAATVPDGLMAMRSSLHLVEQQPNGVMRWSDYAAFVTRGRPVLFISDGTNKHYHQPTDTFDTLDLPKQKREADYLLNIVTEIGNLSDNPTFNANGTDYQHDATVVAQLLEQALETGGLVDSIGLSANSRSNLQADQARVATIKTSLDNGGTLTSTQLGELRTAAQRIMCLAGTMYSEAMCNFF